MLVAQRIDNLGLTERDREVLQLIAGSTKPVGLSRISSILLTKPKAILELYESYLTKIGLIELGSKGREITDKGRKHLENLYF